MFSKQRGVGGNAEPQTFKIMNWLTNKLSELFTMRYSANSDSGKSFDEIYHDLGAFEYDENGFVIQHKDFTKRIDWTDITQLNVYKVDQYITDRIDMEIVCDDKAFTISEEVPGWHQFIIKTKEIFPTIPKEWDMDIIQPPFATNYTTIYSKGK